MSTLNEKNSKKESVWKVTKVVLAILGLLSLTLSLLAVFNVLDNILIAINFQGAYGETERLWVALISALIGIVLLFFAFSTQIDRFFDVIESKELKLSRDERKAGLSLEMLFFLIIGIFILVIALSLGIGRLTIVNELPLLGKYTEPVITGSLVVLSLVSIAVAFNEIIRNAWKELKKVHWPNNKQMAQYSAQVFTFIIFFGVLFLLFDLAVGNGLAGLRNLLG